MKSVDLIGHIKFLSWRQLDGCSVTRPFLSLRRVWLVKLMVQSLLCQIIAFDLMAWSGAWYGLQKLVM